MNTLNSIILEGNLVKDPECSQTPRGTPVCRMTVASNRYYSQESQKKAEVSFFDVEVWNKTAERCGSSLAKGRGVRVVGRLKQDRWVDDQGRTLSRVKIVGDHVEFKPVIRREGAEGQESPESPADQDAPGEELNGPVRGQQALLEAAVPTF